MAKKTSHNALESIDLDLISTPFLDLFDYLQNECLMMLQTERALTSARTRLLLASLEMFITLCNKWTRSTSRRIDKSAKLIVRQKRQEARLLYAELHMAIQEQKSPHAWDSVRLPKITDKDLAELWLREGLIKSIEEVYAHLSREEEKAIEAKLKSRVLPDGYEVPHLWALVELPK